VGLPQWFIKAYSDPGDVVFDPFMGSGSTLIAAQIEGRVAAGTEISAGYCDVICRRFQRATGVKPILEATGQPHDFDLDE
jgi:DNA modification methylase